MPCLQYKKLKTKNEYGTHYAYVPCGQCVDCRKKLQNAWKFRLVSEFMNLKRKGWNIGFVTLTYNDSHLPHIPQSVFEDKEQYREIACFSRSDVRYMIDQVRQYCKYHYKFKNDDNIRYFISSEYGSLKKRPHYHMIMAWPGRVGYEKMHKLIKKNWENGIVFPRDYRGDQATNCMSFEVVGDPSKALSYVSKYVCKDLDYVNEVNGIKFHENRVWKNCQPFHMQSKSLGFETIKNMSDDEKRDVLVNGMSFVGDGQVYQIPVYVKNKIFYNNYYVEENGKRLVKRKASEFFEKYRKEIFEEKARFYTKMFKESESSQYYIDRGVEREVAEKFANSILYYRNVVNSYCDGVNDSNFIGKLYLAYFGVKFDSCYNQDLCEQWMMRYREVNPEIPAEYRVNSQALWSLNKYCSLVLGCNTFVNISKMEERENEEIRLARIRDFYNNVLQSKLI